MSTCQAHDMLQQTRIRLFVFFEFYTGIVTTWMAFQSIAEMSWAERWALRLNSIWRKAIRNATHKKSQANINSTIKETQRHTYFCVGKRSVSSSMRSICIRCVNVLLSLSRCVFIFLFYNSKHKRSNLFTERTAVSFVCCVCVYISRVDMLMSLKIETHSISLLAVLCAALLWNDCEANVHINTLSEMPNTNTKYSMKMQRKALWFRSGIVCIHFLCASIESSQERSITMFLCSMYIVSDFNRSLHSLSALFAFHFLSFSLSLILSSSFRLFSYFSRIHSDNKIFKWHYKLLHTKYAMKNAIWRSTSWARPLLFHVRCECESEYDCTGRHTITNTHRTVECMAVSWCHDALRTRNFNWEICHCNNNDKLICFENDEDGGMNCEAKTLPLPTNPATRKMNTTLHIFFIHGCF